MLLQLGALLLQAVRLLLELLALARELGRLGLELALLALQLGGLRRDRHGLGGQAGRLGAKPVRPPSHRDRVGEQCLGAFLERGGPIPEGGQLLVDRRLALLELSELRLELGVLVGILGGGDLLLQVLLLRDDRGELRLEHLAAAQEPLGLAEQRPRAGPDLGLLRADRTLLDTEAVLLGAKPCLLGSELRRLALEPGLLLLERGRLRLQVGLLLLQLRLLLFERRLVGLQLVALLLELLLLRLPVLLLLFQLALKGLGVRLVLDHDRIGRRLRLELRGDQEGAVVARAEAVADQVVRLALLRRLRGRADVLLPELQGEERDDQRCQDRSGEQHGDPRVTGDETGPRGPEALSRGLLGRVEKAWQAERLDPATDEREERRHQRDGTDDGGDDRHRGGVADRRDERDPGDGECEQRDHDCRAGEHDRRPGRRDGACDRLADLHAATDLVEVAHDEEEGVVDPDAQPDHRGERRRDARHLDDVAEEADQAEARRERDDRDDDRHAHRDDRPEREREDEHRRDDPDHLARLRRRLGELGADRATCCDLHAGLLPWVGRVQHGLRLLLGQVGRADVEQDRDVGRLPVVRNERGIVLRERVGCAVDVRDLDDRLVRALDRRLVGRVRHLALRGVEDDRALPVLLGWEVLGEEVGRLLAAGAGKAHVVVGLGADPRDQGTDARRE